MIINAIKNTYFNNIHLNNFRKSSYTPSFLNQLSCDTVCFTSKPITKTKKERDAEDYLVNAAKQLGVVEGETKTDTIENLVEYIVSQDEMNSGSEGEVYEVEGTNLLLKTLERTERKDLSIELTKKMDALNNVFYRAKDTLFIEKINGIDNSFVAKTQSEKEYSIIAASMPQEAFDDYFKNICDVHKNGFFYDNIGHNMIIDVKNDRFRPIDIYDSDKFIKYKKFDIPNEYIPYSIEPIECMIRTSEVSRSYANHPDFYIKTMRSIANDFEYFTMFQFDKSRYEFGADTPEEKAMVEDLYQSLLQIQNAKMEYYEKGYSKHEIQELMTYELNAYNEFIDKKVEFYNYPKRGREEIERIIELRTQYYKLEKSITGENEPKFTGDYEKDQEMFQNYRTAKIQMAEIQEQIAEIKKGMKDKYYHCFDF